MKSIDRRIIKREVQSEFEALITLDELCLMLDKAKHTIYKWTSSGKIPYYKIGGDLKFDPVEIRKWMKRRSSEKMPAA